MNLSEIKVLLSQDGVTEEIKAEVLHKATLALYDELAVEVIVEKNMVTIDIYNEVGVLEDRGVYRYSNEEELNG